MENFISISCNQSGFKENHSTELCVFAFKETFDYYRKLGTPIFARFIGIRSAFDRVCHSRLFKKTIQKGDPSLYPSTFNDLVLATETFCEMRQCCF